MSAAAGKTCLVTGGAGGLGKAIAKAFLAAGAQVIVCDINQERVSQATTELAPTGRFRAVTADVTDPEAMRRLFGDFARLDILVNNAAIMDRFEPVADLDLDLWERVLAVNLTAPLLLSKLAVRDMLSRPEPDGCIINVASAAAKAGWLAGTAYTTSKHGLIGLTKSTASFYGDKGIRCNALMLGPMADTNIADAFLTDSHSQGRQRVTDILTGTRPRFCHVGDVAELCVSLACGQGWNLVNGGVVAVDHGWLSLVG